MTAHCVTLEAMRARIRSASPAGTSGVRLLAVSKGQPAAAIRELVRCGQRAFGENYVQEALAKQRELDGVEVQWHIVGPLQSNKCRDVAQHFDWLESLDRAKLVPLLGAARPPGRPPLNVLIQVNIDDESSKHGCNPSQIDELARRVVATPGLVLRGLMAIPAPHPDPSMRIASFRRMSRHFEALRARHPCVDTLSMGMSEDFEEAIACGATEVRIGTALFGPRHQMEPVP